MKKLLKWGGIALVVFIIIGAIAGGGDKNTSSSSTTEQTAKAEQNYKTGDTIKTKNMEIVVTSVSEKNSVGGQFLNEKPSEGATLVAVQWKYKNASDKPINTFSFPTIKLLDASGTEYNSDLGKTSAYATEIKLDRKVLSDLNPGITVNDAQIFEVSKESYTKGAWKVQVKADGDTYLITL